MWLKHLVFTFGNRWYYIEDYIILKSKPEDYTIFDDAQLFLKGGNLSEFLPEFSPGVSLSFNTALQIKEAEAQSRTFRSLMSWSGGCGFESSAATASRTSASSSFNQSSFISFHDQHQTSSHVTFSDEQVWTELLLSSSWWQRELAHAYRQNKNKGEDSGRSLYLPGDDADCGLGPHIPLEELHDGKLGPGGEKQEVEVSTCITSRLTWTFSW